MCQDEEAGSGDCRRAAFEAQLLPCNAAKLSLPILLAGYGGIHFVTESGVILQNEDGSTIYFQRCPNIAAICTEI